MPVPVTNLGALLAAGTLGPADVLVDAARPLALLPVRLETRLFATGGQAEVRIRVYPDKIHLDAHDPDLTAEVMRATFLAWYPNCELETIADAGHYAVDETPVLLAASLDAFLS